MTTTTTTPRLDATERDERRRKRAAIVKFSLAGAAVLGIGAAATSAGWTDDAWFAASASAVDPETAIDLRGAYVASGVPEDDAFTSADDRPGAGLDYVRIPGDVFSDLTAGDEVTVPVWIKNFGTSDLTIATPEVTATGDLFGEGGAKASLGDAPSELAAKSGPAQVDLTITLPDDADAQTFGGAEGDVVIQFQGSITRS